MITRRAGRPERVLEARSIPVVISAAEAKITGSRSPGMGSRVINRARIEKSIRYMPIFTMVSDDEDIASSRTPEMVLLCLQSAVCNFPGSFLLRNPYSQLARKNMGRAGR